MLALCQCFRDSLRNIACGCCGGRRLGKFDYRFSSIAAGMAADTAAPASPETPQQFSDDDSDCGEVFSSTLKGSLFKWTNYIHGWQPRYFIMQDGTLAYYKSETDMAFGCRGAIQLVRAIIQAHEFDECRFEVSVNDSVWYLRADSSEERQRWMEVLETYKTESGYGSQTDLRRHGSLVSLTSNRSLASNTSFKASRSLKEKLAELETFRDIVCQQVDSLQGYFDACASSATPSTLHDKTLDAEDVEADLDDEVHDTLYPRQDGSPHEEEKGISSSHGSMDFKGEALTFKATTSGILTTLQHCIELMQQREDLWKKRLEREVERRKRAEESNKATLSEFHKFQSTKSKQMVGGPDFEEGPNSTMNEEEWHDAVDAALDREDIEDARFIRLTSKPSSMLVSRVDENISLPREHYMFQEVDGLTHEQLKYALAGVEEGVWQLFAEDGEMKMFKRDEEIDGMICDPLKAVHTIKGVTAHEYCHYFFESEYKLDWDTTLEKMEVVDRVSKDTLIFHQVHKRIWPANQRESLFWSHLRRMDAYKDPECKDLYIVCNKDTTRDEVPVNSKCLRVGLTVAMVCQTVVPQEKADKPETITRDDLTCKIVYVAQVNPGGWAPASALRIVYKREYPKFLKRFTQYVVQKTLEKPAIMF